MDQVKVICVLGFMVFLASCGQPQSTTGDGTSMASLTPTFASISQNILQPKCVSCHSGPSAPMGKDYTTYAKVMSSGAVVAGNSAASAMYVDTASGAMPQGGPALSASEVAAIKSWIDSGALNN